jgi:hypothetical protein
MPQWSIARNQMHRSSPEHKTQFAAVAHSAKDLKVEYLDELETIFETALDSESGDHLGTSNEIT